MGSNANKVGKRHSPRQRTKGVAAESTLLQKLPDEDADHLRLLSELQVHQIELKLQNEELRQTRGGLETVSRRYWSLYHNAPVGYLTLDAEGRIVEANASAAELLERGAHLLLGVPFSSLVDEAFTLEFAAFLHGLNAGAVTDRCEVTLALTGPAHRTVQLNGSTSSGGCEGVRLLLTLVDITSRRLAEEALRRAHDEMEREVRERTRDLACAHALLRQSESRLKRAQTVAGIGVWECDLTATGDLFWSDEVFELLELEERGKVPNLEMLGELVHPDDRHLLSRSALLGYVRGHQLQLQVRIRTKKTGTVRHLQVHGETTRDADGNPVLVMGTVQDITALIQAQQDRLHVEQQLWQAQKLESLGLLAGGVAHDFNNLLQGVLGNVDLALSQSDLDSETIRYLDNIRSTSARLSELVQQLLTYAGRGRSTIKPVNMNQVVADMSQLLAASLRKNVEITYELAEELPAVDGDAVQLGQVFMNLVINAAESLGDGAGRIRVSSGALAWDGSDRSDLVLDGNLPAGRQHVFLDVIDSGCGMSEETKRRIFEPFFSTKFVGRGLGLPVVLGIVRSHGGALGLWSEPGKGTRIRVVLPSGKDSIQADPSRTSQVQQLWRGSGLVLLADDEPMVRNTTGAALKRMGFEVALAVDGMAAIDVMQQRGGDVRLALLDVNMPRMDGLEAMRIIRQKWPATKVVLASGYTSEQAMVGIDSSERPGFLPKPFELAQLVQALKVALGGDCGVTPKNQLA